MYGKAIEYDQGEEEILTCAVSDEALEAAGMSKDKAGSMTMSFCAGLSPCPA